MNFKPLIRRPAFAPLGATLALLLMLAGLGWWTGELKRQNVDAEMRGHLLQQVSDIARLLNPELIRQLSFSAADKGTASFEVIREQLMALGKRINNRGIYSVAQHDGKLRFGPENYPINDPLASPPGTEYKQPPAEIKGVFQAKQPVTVGPYTDEYGTFVSAFAPVLDPQSGEVMLVVGLDILATDWKAKVNVARLSPLLTSLVVFLMLLVGMAGVRWNNRRRLVTDRRLKNWIMAPVALAMLVGLAAFIMYQNQFSHNESRRDLQRLMDRASSQWNRLVFNQVQLLKAQLNHISNDPTLRAAWQIRDRETLIALSQPVLDEMKREFKVTHFNLIEPNRNIFLRVHQPKIRNGTFDRYSQLLAARTDTDAWGIETSGAIGVFTLRYVRPWSWDGQTIGYLELGMEINHLVDMLAKDMDADIVSVIRKEFSTREKFNAGKLLFNFSGDWDAYPELVVAHQTLPALPLELVHRFKAGHLAFQGERTFRLCLADRAFDGGFLHVPDAAGRDVADFIVLSDVTAKVAADRGILFQDVALALLFFTGVIVLLWSVTNRAEKQLDDAFSKVKDSETKHRVLFEDSPDAYLLLVNGVFTECNRAAEIMLRGTRKQIIGLAPDAVSPTLQPEGGKSVEVARQRVSEALRTGNQTFEWVHRRLDGEDFHVEVSLSTMTLSGQQVLFAAWRDITERRRSEAALRESETRLRAITDSAQDAILMMNSQGLVSYWNPAAERILGYTSSEAIGQNLHTFIVPQRYHGAHHTAFPAFQQTGQGAAVGKTLDLAARRKDGREISVQLSLSALQMNGGWHAVGMLRDITERKQAEVKLFETNQQLQNAIVRANELAIHADQASQAKSEFLANMSHEIRTPLNGVIGMTGLLLEAGLNADQRRYAETVRNSGEALLALINDILDFSKIEAGKLELETLDFDLSGLLNDFAASLALRAHDKGLEFICSAAPDVPNWLRGDPGRLRQILTNLAGNAVKFTKKGEVVVQASLISETDTEAMMRFSVRDTGIGIPTHKKDRLFQKFTQVDASVTRHFGGTGLGLAISKQLVQLMGGEVGVESTEGCGSEFWFTTRLAKQAGREHPDLPPAELRGTHILVVDDNATNREVLKAQLQAWGVRAEETADGVSALEALTRASNAGDPFQTAILDMQMPGMDGATLGRAIKTDAQLNTTRLVMLSSLGRRGDTELMDQIGFAACLTKPARPSELFDCLASTLTSASMPQSAQPAPILPQVGESGMGVIRILLAEDNLTNQQVALGMLKRLGLQAHVVENGAHAVKAFEAHPFDLVFMDMQMPEMDGLEATRQIRTAEGQRLKAKVEVLQPTSPAPIPIIAMTANAMQGDREKCLAAGMNDYLSKPVTFQALVAALEKWRPREAEKMAAAVPNVTKKAAPIYTKGLEVPVFDHAEMMDRFMDDEELARTVVETFLDDTPKQIRALKGYLVARDIPSTQRQAHTIKGAAANVSGKMLQAVAFEMEQAARAGDLETVTARLPELELQFARLQAAISEYDMQIVTR
jgi:PAS domain S-box-containing protein